MGLHVVPHLYTVWVIIVNVLFSNYDMRFSVGFSTRMMKIV